MPQLTKTKVAVVDDHVLLRTGLANFIRGFDQYDIIFEADNGKDFINRLAGHDMPDVVLLDINMPEMDGFETSLWLKRNHPAVKVLALSMYDNENAIIRMLKNGAKGYVLKDIDPAEFKAALDALVRKGFYYSDLVTGKLVHAVNSNEESDQPVRKLINLSDREIDFLKFACSEMTYKEIADKMYLSPRTIDGYRDALFEKLNCKTRVGLVMYAIKNGVVTV